MKLVADAKIPYVREWFAPHFDIIQLESEQVIPSAIQQADILLVRSTCKVNAALLEGSTIKIIASATSGFDHVDLDYVRKSARQFFYAPGCNAHTVAEYVQTAMRCLALDNLLPSPCRAGIIGVGRVGTAVATQLQALGMEIIYHDPPRALIDPHFTSVPLEEFADCDVVSVHTPLTFEGPHPTFHFLSADFFHTLKPGCVLLNAARGAVVDSQALLQEGQHLRWILDVFEGEPAISPELVAGAYLATPHIAGHSVESHWRGVRQIYQQIFAACGLVCEPLPALPRPTLPENTSEILHFYDPRVDTRALKTAVATHRDLSAFFSKLRQHYQTRHEFSVAANQQQ
jgi:erythronate-4-phosphate dehydrogenase